MTNPQYFYRVHGFVIASELDFPELAPIDRHSIGAPDIGVKLGRLPADLAIRATDIPDMSVTPGGVMLTIPEAGRFQISRGAEVTVEVADGADMSLLRLFFFGSVMGLLCHQRGVLPLHASAVAFDDHAIAFCGPAGIGKSTLAAVCVESGAQLVADDILVVSSQGGSQATANPGMPKFKLWRDAIEGLGGTTAGLSRDWARADKFHVPAGAKTVTEPVRLSRIFVLEDDADPDAGGIKIISGSEALSELIQNTYRPEYLDLAGRRAAHFADCVRLTGLTTVARLRRRRDAADLGRTALMLMDRATQPP
jgi:hypothetical protein